MLIAAILLSSLSALFPFRLGRIPVNMVTVPLALLLVLLASGVVPVRTLAVGLTGNGLMRPWEILVIFFSTAYVSISVDMSGVLDWLAYRVVRRSRGSGRRLFVFFYLFSCVLTVFTSNDIVILILTPIIFYLGRHARLNTLPLLFAAFFGANTASMLLLIGNPTNVIVGAALRIPFPAFTAVMWFPTLTAVLLAGLFLFLRWRKELTVSFSLPADAAPYSLRNRWDALFSSGVLLLMLLFLAGSHTLGIPIWVVTVAAAALLVTEDILFGIYYVGRKIRLPLLLRAPDTAAAFGAYGLREHALESWITIKRVPWKIAPFIIVLFILVAGLNREGLTAALQRLLVQAAEGSGMPLLVWGGAGTLLANLLNNQPMSILAAEMLGGLPASGGAYAVVVAANLGANLTLIGSLAGLMWKRILEGAGIRIGYRQFFLEGLRIVPPVLLGTLLALRAVV